MATGPEEALVEAVVRVGQKTSRSPHGQSLRVNFGDLEIACGNEGIPADCNLTILEATLAFGKDYGKLIRTDMFTPDVMQLFHLLFNPLCSWTFPLGVHQMIVLDWGDEEGLLTNQTRFGHLPHASKAMSDKDLKLVEYALALPENRKAILLSHYTWICYDYSVPMLGDLSDPERLDPGREHEFPVSGEAPTVTDYNFGACWHHRDKMFELFETGKIAVSVSGHAHRPAVYFLKDSADATWRTDTWQQSKPFYRLDTATDLAALGAALEKRISCVGFYMEEAKKLLEGSAIGQIFLIALISMGNILRVQGRPNLGLIFMVAGNVLNAGLAALAIFGLHWGVAGAALATTISVALNLAAVLIFVQSPASLLRIRRRHLVADAALARSILVQGAPIFLMQILGTVQFLVANRGAAGLDGARGVAVVGVFNTISILLIYPPLGVAQAMLPLVAFNRGAGNFGRVRSLLVSSLVITMAMGVIFAVTVALLPGPVASIFTKSDLRLVELVRLGLPWFMISVALFGIQGTASHYFLASQEPRKAGILLLGRSLLSIPLFLVMPGLFGFFGLYLVAPLSDVPFAVVAVVLLRKEWKKLTAAEREREAAAIVEWDEVRLHKRALEDGKALELRLEYREAVVGICQVRREQPALQTIQWDAPAPSWAREIFQQAGEEWARETSLAVS